LRPTAAHFECLGLVVVTFHEVVGDIYAWESLHIVCEFVIESEIFHKVHLTRRGK
jgi:hypothetical protein